MDAVMTRPRAPLPRRSLGPIVEEWMARNLVDFVTGEPLILTDEQSHFLWNFYALDDSGRFRYDRAAMVRARGTGKSPFAAYLAAAELCGPVRFSRWDAEGFPIAKAEASPDVAVFAVTLEQCRPIFDALVSCWTERAIAQYGLDIQKTQITKTAFPRGKARMLPNNPRAIRGFRLSFALCEEASEWVQTNQGHDAMIRIRANLVKHTPIAGRLVEMCNPYVPGEDSVAERTHIAWMKQSARPEVRTSILYDWRAAPDGVDLSDPVSLRAGLIAAAGDATWLDIDSLMGLMADSSVRPETFRREHLAQLITAEDSVLSSESYGQCTLGTLRPLQSGDTVALGFDGSLSHDGTALVAFRMADRSFHLLHYDEPDPQVPDWRIDEVAVDEVVRSALAIYNVVAFHSDVHPFDGWVAGWERDFGHTMEADATPAHPIAKDMRTDLRGLTFSFMALVNEIEAGRVIFPESDLIKYHWLNAKRRENRHGFSFGKITRNSTLRVDIVAACLLAHIAGNKYLDTQSVAPEPTSITALSW